jgi:hypothetical protein
MMPGDGVEVADAQLSADTRFPLPVLAGVAETFRKRSSTTWVPRPTTGCHGPISTQLWGRTSRGSATRAWSERGEVLPCGRDRLPRHLARQAFRTLRPGRGPCSAPGSRAEQKGCRRMLPHLQKQERRPSRSSPGRHLPFVQRRGHPTRSLARERGRRVVSRLAPPHRAGLTGHPVCARRLKRSRDRMVSRWGFPLRDDLGAEGVIPCREALAGSAHQVKGLDRRGPRHQETTMQEITEEPQDRTGSSVRRHDEYTPQELAGGRS